MYSLFHDLCQFLQVCDLIVYFGVGLGQHVITEEQAADVVVLDVARHGQVTQHFVDVHLECILTALLDYAEPSLSEISSTYM